MHNVNMNQATIPLLSTVEPDNAQKRLAAAVVGVSLAVFLVVAPYAKVELPALWAFLPTYQSAYVVVTLVTAILLIGQFRVQRSWALLILAEAYLFDALMAVVHTLSFPGLFSAAGLLGGGPQTTAWLYFMWHGGFPMFVAGYASLGEAGPGHPPQAAKAACAIIAATVSVLALVGAMTLLATAGHDLLPPIMHGNLDEPSKVFVASLTWLLSLVALAILWRRRRHSLLDVWLMVVVCVWIFDSALAAVLNHGRFDVGWYAGRIYGLIAGSLVLGMLVLENSALVLQLARLMADEQRQSSARLSESEAINRGVIESSMDGFWMVDPKGRIKAVNDAYVRRSGYSREEILAMRVNDFDVHEDPEAVAERIAKVTATGSDLFETHHRAKDGSVWPVEVMATYWPEAGGRYFAFLRDITERKRILNALRESETRFRLTFDLAAIGLAHVSLDGRWLRINPMLCEMLGFSAEELKSARFQDLTHPDDLEADLGYLRQLLAGEMGVCTFDKRYVRKDGSILWAHLTVSVAPKGDGALDYFITVIEDVSARRRAEDELRTLRLEMERLTKFQVASQTVTALAHELNQPLNAVSTYAAAALRMLSSDDVNADKLRHALQGSAQQAQRAGQVVRDLMAYLNQGTVATEAVDLTELIHRTVGRTTTNYRDRVRFRMELVSELPAVSANRLQLEKVLTNLIDNGIEAMRDAGVPDTDIVVTVGSSEDGGMAQVTVRDTGPGIGGHLMRRIFEPFFTTKPGGLGMGLAISRAIIEAHGGQLWAESQPGTGAIFHFTLPFAS
jgi:PAS domain S-box-containing protein